MNRDIRRASAAIDQVCAELTSIACSSEARDDIDAQIAELHIAQKQVLAHECLVDCHRQHVVGREPPDAVAVVASIAAKKFLQRHGYYAQDGEDAWTTDMRECMIAVSRSVSDPVYARESAVKMACVYASTPAP